MNSTNPDRPDLRLGRPVVSPNATGRRSPVRWILLVVALLVVTAAMGVLGFEWGSRRDGAEPNSAAPATSGTGRFSAAGAATASTRPPRAAAKPQLAGTLITKNKGSDQDPNRVFNAVGQGSTTEPRFVVRAGERVRVKLLNRDNVVHSFTIDPARVNVDIFAHTSEATTFRAPLKPGEYSFYCRYRKVGMNGTLVVRGR